MAVSPAVRVGIILFIAVVAFIAVYYFLIGVTNFYYVTAIFDNAMSLTEGSAVTMAGVPIGVVDRISLDENQRAQVRMKINPKYQIPEGSRFILRVGLLIGEKFIDVIPNRQARTYIRPGTVVEGEVPIRIEDLLPKTERLISNLTEVSENLKNVLGDEEFEGRINRSLANIERATARLDQAMATIQSTVTGGQEEIRVTIRNVALASENVLAATQELERFARQGGLQENIGAAVAATRRAVESLERTTASLEGVVTAPEFQEDIRVTVRTARETVEQARDILDRLGGIFGGGGRARIPTRETGIEAVFRPEDGRFRANLTATLGSRSDKFLNLGIYDVGAGNKLILQPGKAIGSQTDLRYGIYASRLGIGLDHGFSDRVFGTLNLYDPYEPKLDIQAGYKLDDTWGLLLGVDDLFDENKFTLGARYTR